MKRYRFRLAAVLRLRAMEEEQAREALLVANRKLNALIVARDAEMARYRSLGAETLATTLDGLRAEQQRAELVAAGVAAANRAVGVAASEVAIAQITWSSARRRVRVLERLDERRREEYREGESHAEVVEVDDIVTARYVAASAAGELTTSGSLS